MSQEGNQANNRQRIDQIVRLASQGYRDKEIAQQLGVKVTTVRTYWDRLYIRTGVNNRVSAIVAYIRDEYEAQLEKMLKDDDTQRQDHKVSLKSLTDLLSATQQRLAEAEKNVRELAFLECALMTAHAAPYELSSVSPVRYRYLSLSSRQLGMDVEAFLRGENTFYNHVDPDDLPLLYEASHGAKWLPDERYMFLYRMRMSESRWVLDTHQAIYDDKGDVTSIVGVAIDVHELVVAGFLEPVVSRTVISASPIT